MHIVVCVCVCAYFGQCVYSPSLWPADADGSGVVSHDSVHQLKSTKGDHCKSRYHH